MSYSIDANLMLYASDEACSRHGKALAFLEGRARDPDLLCVSWLTLMAYQRIATHPSIFARPLSPSEAWENIERLLALPRVRVIVEEETFARDYTEMTAGVVVRGNLVPDAHLAALLRQHGVGRLYSCDTDFRKFDTLEVINPLL